MLFRSAGKANRAVPARRSFLQEDYSSHENYGYLVVPFRAWRGGYHGHAFALAAYALAQGLAGTPEQHAEQAKLEESYPKLQVNDRYLRLSIPGQTMGQTVGVATNSKGHLFVYSRSVNQGLARGGKAAMLWEFDQNYKFVKEWGPNNYAEAFAHAVRVDKQDNVWQVDEGSGMIVKYDPEGQHIFWLGRTPEAIDYLQGNLEILHFGRTESA